MLVIVSEKIKGRFRNETYPPFLNPNTTLVNASLKKISKVVILSPISLKRSLEPTEKNNKTLANVLLKEQSKNWK